MIWKIQLHTDLYYFCWCPRSKFHQPVYSSHYILQNVWMSPFNKHTLCYNIETSTICAISAYTFFSFSESLNISRCDFKTEMLIYIFKYIQLCPRIPMGPHFNKSSAVITKCKFCIILPFWESSVNVHFSFRSDNSPDKILCLQMPQLYPSPVHQQSQHWSCKLCILSLSLSKLREQFQKNIHWFSVGKWNRKSTVHIYIFFFFTEHYVCRCPRSTCY